MQAASPAASEAQQYVSHAGSLTGGGGGGEDAGCAAASEAAVAAAAAGEAGPRLITLPVECSSRPERAAACVWLPSLTAVPSATGGALPTRLMACGSARGGSGPAKRPMPPWLPDCRKPLLLRTPSTASSSRPEGATGRDALLSMLAASQAGPASTAGLDPACRAFRSCFSC